MPHSRSDLMQLGLIRAVQRDVRWSLAASSQASVGVKPLPTK